MKKSVFLRQLIWVMILCFSTFLANASLPKFSIIPMLRPQTPIASNGIALAQYLIINNTFQPRYLTIAPQPGVIQLPIAGSCPYPFLLYHGQSCVLTLQILGALTIGGVHSGPSICKTMGVGDNNPDFFLCSAVDPNFSLKVNTTSTVLPATITGTPTPLIFTANVGAGVTITNTSIEASADNLKAFLPPDSNFTVISDCPRALAPQSSCQLFFNSTIAGSTTVIIQGSNTNPLTIPLTSVMPMINLTLNDGKKNSSSVKVGPLTLESGSSSTTYRISIVVPQQNDKIQKLLINIPSDTPISLGNNSCSSGLDKLNPTCTLDFLAGRTTGSGTITIQGLDDNLLPLTNILSLPVRVISSQLATITISPSVGTINVDDPSRSTNFTITNISASPISAVSVHATLPASWINVSQNPAGNCDNLAPGASCKLSFTATAPYLAEGGIKINGESISEPVSIALAFEKGGGLVFDVNEGLATVVSLDKANIKSSPEPDAILPQDLNSACQYIIKNGYNDWYQPAKDDLSKINYTLSLLAIDDLLQQQCVRKTG
ncbi:MAG: hypothetical protein H0T84_01490 [Tatlockia sp.]|nr:hypothetical protein [Tatlockia sp.]